jgi:hypothetical protein
MSGYSYERREALKEAMRLCVDYSDMLAVEKPEWAEVALECARMIGEQAQLVPTTAETGSGSCQEPSTIFVLPEIDYGSGFPRK